MKCQVCNSNNVEAFLNLGDNPACDFLTKEQIDEEKTYPLIAGFCPDCTLVQIQDPVDQKILFNEDYHHIAALSSSFKEHLEKLAVEIVKRFELTSDDLFVELGSNDGALLAPFKELGVKVLGVDPSDIGAQANEKGLTTLVDYFDSNLADTIVTKYGKAKVMAALNTFAHVSDVGSVVEGIEKLLTDDGVFISENHHSLKLIEELQYDFMYHEHSRYYSVGSLVQLFDRHNMDVFDVEHIPTHSGSIRVFACKRGAYPISENVAKALTEEKEKGLGDSATYKEFANKVEKHKKVFGDMIRDLKKEGKTIAGLTFPARAITLLSASDLGPKSIDYITELSTIKIGKYAPGSHIEVVDQEILFGDNAPDVGILLSWHIADEIIPRFRQKGFKGDIIVPLPEPRVLSV